MVGRDGPVGWYARAGARGWRCPPAPVAARAFHAGLPGYRPTPLVELPVLAADLDVGQVFVKDESQRLGLPAFKVLGASWAVARVVAERAGCGADGLDVERLRTLAAASGPQRLVTATDGNHGRAVARMARLLGLSATVVVPSVTRPEVAAAIAAEGALVVRHPGSYDAAVAAAAELVTAPGTETRALVQDTGWEGYEDVPGWIVDGYATLFAELDQQLVDAGPGSPDLLVVPVGVGSLAQAAVVHLRGRAAPGGALLGVEPDRAACVLASLRRGRPVTVATPGTVMAGLDCGTPSALAWPFLRDGMDAVVTVTDAEAERAVAELAAQAVSSGPSGAATLAGARVALTGSGADDRRQALGLPADAVVVLLSTEASPDGLPSAS